MPLTMKTLLDSCYDYDNQKYDFELIDNEKYHPTIDHPLWIISHYQFKYLLGHQTVKELLNLKMNRGPRIVFWIDILLYFAFLIMLTIYHINLTAVETMKYNDSSYNISILSNQTYNQQMLQSYIHFWPSPFKLKLDTNLLLMLFLIFKIYFTFILSIYILKKIFQITNYGIKMMYSIKHWLEIFCFLFNFLSLVIPENSSSFGSLSVLFGWISFAFYFQSFGAFKLGSYSLALRETIQNSFKLLP